MPAGTLRGVVVRDNPVLTELDQHLAIRQPRGASTDASGDRRSKRARRARSQLPGALIGKSLAADLGVRPGDPIVVISPASLGVGAGTPRLRRFVVEGFFYSGMYEFDSSLIFVALADAQALLADDYQAESGLEVRVSDLFDAPAIGRQIGRDGRTGLHG